MNFRTQYDRIRCVSDSGSPEHILYRSKIDKFGNIELVEDGFINTYERIQAFKDSTDINKVIARFMAGDESALSKAQGLYFDASKLPNSFSGMLNFINDAQQAFENLPVDIRRQFGFSFEKFVTSSDQEVGEAFGSDDHDRKDVNSSAGDNISVSADSGSDSSVS